jgi:hypothetical protein
VACVSTTRSVAAGESSSLGCLQESLEMAPQVKNAGGDVTVASSTVPRSDSEKSEGGQSPPFPPYPLSSPFPLMCVNLWRLSPPRAKAVEVHLVRIWHDVGHHPHVHHLRPLLGRRLDGEGGVLLQDPVQFSQDLVPPFSSDREPVAERRLCLVLLGVVLVLIVVQMQDGKREEVVRRVELDHRDVG